MKNEEIKIIFESPDSGKTTYARIAGTSDRTVVESEDKPEDIIDAIKENKLWGQIRRAAKKNEALRLALEHAKLIYYLGKDHGA